MKYNFITILTGTTEVDPIDFIKSIKAEGKFKVATAFVDNKIPETFGENNLSYLVQKIKSETEK